MKENSSEKDFFSQLNISRTPSPLPLFPHRSWHHDVRSWTLNLCQTLSTELWCYVTNSNSCHNLSVICSQTRPLVFSLPMCWMTSKKHPLPSGLKICMQYSRQCSKSIYNKIIEQELQVRKKMVCFCQEAAENKHSNFPLCLALEVYWMNLEAVGNRWWPWRVCWEAVVLQGFLEMERLDGVDVQINCNCWKQ